MPRFEMYLMLAEKEDDKVETCEYEMICWVKDSTNIEEIKASANEKINDHIGDIIRDGQAKGEFRPANALVAQNMLQGAINASMDIAQWRQVDDLDATAIEYYGPFCYLPARLDRSIARPVDIHCIINLRSTGQYLLAHLRLKAMTIEFRRSKEIQ